MCPREKTVSSNIVFTKDGSSTGIYAHCCTGVNTGDELGLSVIFICGLRLSGPPASEL